MRKPKNWASIFSVLSAVLLAVAWYPSKIVGHGYRVSVADQSTPLVGGQTATRTISGTDTQTFTTEFFADQCADLNVTWSGPDLQVLIQNLDGTPLLPRAIPIHDSENFPILILPTRPGRYSIQLQPVEQTKPATVEIKLSTIRSPNDSDKKRFRAQELLLLANQQNSKDLYLESLKLWQVVQDLSGQTYTLRQLAKLHLSLKQTEEASKLYSELIELRKAFNDQRRLLFTFREIGIDYRGVGLFEEAASFYRRALEIARAINARALESALLYSIGFAEASVAHYSVAMEFYEQARKIQHDDNDRLNEAKTLNAMGGAYNSQGDQASALAFYQQAVSIFEELNDGYRLAVASNNVGVAYDDLGQWQDSKNYYGKALVSLESLLENGSASCLKDITRIANICTAIASTIDNVGELSNSTGDPEAALGEFAKSLPIRQNVTATLKNPRWLGSTLSRICYSYVLLGKASQAIAKCEEAIALIDQKNDPTTWASAQTFLGMAYAASGFSDRAIKRYEDAREIHRKTNVPRGEGIALNQLGMVYATTGRPEAAAAKFGEALNIWRAIHDEDGQTITLFNIAKLERDRGNFSVAHQYIQQAITIIENRRATLNSQRLLATYFASKQDYYDLAIDVEMRLAKAGNAGLVATALEANERARGRRLLDALAEAKIIRTQDLRSIASQNPALKSAVDQQQSIALKLSAKANARTALFAGSHTAADEERLNKEIEQLTADYDDIDSKIRTLNPVYASLVKPEPLKASEIQQQLDADTLLIEYALGEKRSYVWAVTRESIQGFDLPSSRDEIAEVATQLTDLLRYSAAENLNVAQKDRRLAKYLEVSATLSRMILDPIGSLLKKKRLVIVADGELQLVPFAALVTPQSETLTTSSDVQHRRFLIEDYEIVSLPSASVLAVQRRLLQDRKPAPMSVAVVADPVFDRFDARVRATRQQSLNDGKGRRIARATSSSTSLDGSTNYGAALTRALDDTGVGTIAPLFFSRAEARSILSVVQPGKAKAALGFEASRATVMSPELAQYQIIHFATHSILNFKNPQVSGLVLSMVDEQGRPQNGYLQMHEIYKLNLPAELVVLSACQTGAGKLVRGEGLIALTRGFMYAGAARLVASLWKVDDAATAELMSRFYKEMFTNGKRPAAALRDAQISLSKEKRWRSPYHWGGFFLQGEWR